MENNNNDITDEYDREFINLIMEIEKKSSSLNKYDQLRVRNWCKKLCQVTNNVEWKKNRNLHAICILDGVLNKHFEEPYNKFPGDGPVPILSKTLVKSKLSKKFFINSNEIMQRRREIEENELNNNCQDSIPENNNENDNDDDTITNNITEQKESKKKNQANFVSMNKLKSKFIKIKKKKKL